MSGFGVWEIAEADQVRQGLLAEFKDRQSKLLIEIELVRQLEWKLLEVRKVQEQALEKDISLRPGG